MFTTNKNNKSQARQSITNKERYLEYLDRLTELSIAMFEWKNVPKEIDIRFLEVVLFTSGKALFFQDKDLGNEYLVTRMQLRGMLDIYGIPIQRTAYANNGYTNELSNKNSVIIYNNLLKTPAEINVQRFAKDLANIDSILHTNINAQRTPVLIEADEKQRLTMLNLYKKYEGNEPFIFGNKQMDLGSGIKVLKTDAPFLADQLYSLKVQIWNEALTYLGISNLNITKKERLITDEVTRNQGGTIASRYSRLESRRTACEKINEMFGLDIWVDYREDYQSTEVVATDTIDGEGEEEIEINPVERRSSAIKTDENEDQDKEQDNKKDEDKEDDKEDGKKKRKYFFIERFRRDE